MSTFFDLEQTSHWYPLIWIFAMGIILDKMPKKRELVCGRTQERWYWLSAMLLMAPFIFWTGYRTSGADTYAYALSFNETPASISQIPAVLFSGGKDPGFTALIMFVKACGISAYRDFFLLIAAFQVVCMVYTFRRYSPNFWMSIFLFVASTDYISWMQNGMRQFTAVCMTFAAFRLTTQRRYGLFVLVVLLASTIHGSALLMLPLAFLMDGRALNRKIMLTILFTVLCIPYIDRIIPIIERIMTDTQYSDVMTNEIWSNDDGTNIIRVIVYSIPALVCIFGRRYVVGSDDPAVNQCINASVMTMVLYLFSMVTSGIYVGRLPIYTTLHGYIILPWIIDRIFEKSSARLIKLLAIVCYLAFFYYQMHIAWNML